MYSSKFILETKRIGNILNGYAHLGSAALAYGGNDEHSARKPLSSDLYDMLYTILYSFYIR